MYQPVPLYIPRLAIVQAAELAQLTLYAPFAMHQDVDSPVYRLQLRHRSMVAVAHQRLSVRTAPLPNRLPPELTFGIYR